MKLCKLLSFFLVLVFITLSSSYADDGSVFMDSSLTNGESAFFQEDAVAPRTATKKRNFSVSSKTKSLGIISPVERSLKTLLPGENIGVEMVNRTIALTGMVSNAEVASHAVKIAREYLNDDSRKILNLMQIRSGQQIMLKVRVGEMKRAAIQKLGLGINGVISGGQAVFGALEGNGDFKTLAEPTLTAISGEAAKFLAGGEFPVPVAQAGNTMSVDYKKFGVSVDFTPFVISEKRIRLNVASEVSELSNIGAVKLRGVNIPAVSTRRADTTIELAPGESFMIAGLIKNNENASLSKVPGLGDIPILNLLFRSAEFKRNETELVIAVTPYMADPAGAKDIKLPTDGYVAPNMLEMFMLGKFRGHKKPASSGEYGSGLAGPAGFAID